MGYLYANFTSTSCNFGNCIIDFATRRLLSAWIGPPKAEFNSFDNTLPSGEYDFVLVPGCTMITYGQNPGLEQIHRLGCPVYCLAGSLWAPLPHPGYLLRKRIIGKHNTDIDLRIVRNISTPVGARDPFTHHVLKSAGIETYYVGCPTLTLPDDNVCDGGYILMSLGRDYVRTQTRAAHRLARNNHVIGIVHELHDYDRFRAVGWKLPLVTFRGDVELYLSYFKHASIVVTGRLHGILPSLAYGKRVFYFGTCDTRTTILDDLGVPIHSYSDINKAVDRASSCFNRYLLEYFRNNLNEVLHRTVGRHASRNIPHLVA